MGYVLPPSFSLALSCFLRSWANYLLARQQRISNWLELYKQQECLLHVWITSESFLRLKIISLLTADSESACWNPLLLISCLVCGSKSISSTSGALTLQKYFSHPSFSYLLSSNPTYKIKTLDCSGLQIGGTLLIATLLDQSNYLANQKQGAFNKYDLIVFTRPSKMYIFSGPQESSSGSNNGCNYCKSSKISSAGPHTEHQWRCSKLHIFRVILDWAQSCHKQ